MPDLPNENRDKRFVATGPNQGFTVRGVTGFYTEADKLAYGVNVQGTKCGLYGESGNVPDDRDPAELFRTTAGVFGVGNDYGVFGRGFTTAGVYGENTSSGTGVVGVAVDESIGVAGISTVKGLSNEGHSGTGIVGATEGGQGFGIVGLSLKSLDSAAPIIVPKASIDEKGQVAFSQPLSTGIGVVGASGSGNGVVGISDSAAGVVGKSTSGNGGVFSSDKGAPINLVVQDKLPRDGTAGDLLLINGPVDPDDPEGLQGAILHFCVRSSDPQDPAMWGRVAFNLAHD
jgi:hypothetical protein